MVQIGSQQTRNLYGSALLGLIPDALVAGGAAAYFEGGVPGFFGVLIGLQAVYLLIWIKDSLWSWTTFWLWRKRQVAEALEQFLYKNRFPEPPAYVSAIDDYFQGIIDSNRLHPRIRVLAGIEIGTIAGARLGGRISIGVQWRIAYEAALQQYAKRFPPREDPEEGLGNLDGD